MEKKIYRCPSCGNLVEILHDGGGILKCCAQVMELLTENTTDAATEKHVPVIEKKDGGYLITVGEAPHPMADEHYIQWIELIADGVSYRKFLKPDDTPEAFFKVEATSVSAREYCNLHGLWAVKV